MKLSKLLCEYRQNSHEEWLSPDNFYGDNEAVTFMFGEHGLDFASGDIPHVQIMIDQPEKYVYRYAKTMSDQDIQNGRHRVEAEKYDLLGRVGNEADGTAVVCFWNEDDSLYRKYLPDCLRALAKKGLINSRSFISTPAHGVSTIREYFGNLSKQLESTPKVSADELKKRRELHTMKAGNEKNMVRKELGLTTGSKKHGVQQALEKAGKLSPGHKYWAMTSEDVE